MKTVLLALFANFIFINSNAQEGGSLYLYRSDGTSVQNINNAAYFMNLTKEYGRMENDRVQVVEVFDKGVLTKKVDYVNKIFTNSFGETKPLDQLAVGDTPTKKANLVQVPAEFKGGIAAWGKYLSRNLKTPQRLVRTRSNGTQATVVASFFINTKGEIQNVLIERSYEWSVDTEAMRVIKKGPNWIPATENGKEVLYRHKQSITFAISP